MYDILELNDKLLSDLRQIAKTLNIKRVDSFKKQELIYKILDQQALLAAQSTPVPELKENKENKAAEAAPAERKEKKQRARMMRPGVEKVGDSKGGIGVQKFMRRNQKPQEEAANADRGQNAPKPEVRNEERRREEPKQNFNARTANPPVEQPAEPKPFQKKQPAPQQEKHILHADVIEDTLDFTPVGEQPISYIQPVEENQRVYDQLYAEYSILHDYFGRGENNVMKRLKKIKAEQIAKKL